MTAPQEPPSAHAVAKSTDRPSKRRAAIVALLPARDEESAVAAVLRETASWVDVRIVVDDGSGDATAARAEEAGAVAVRKAPGGKGSAVAAGLKYLRERFDYDAVLLMDADGQHRPSDIARFLEAWREEKPDLILGVRDFSAGSLPRMRAAWNALISGVLSLKIGRRFRDTQCGFRLLSRRAAETLAPREPGYAVETELLLAAVGAGFRIAEVDVAAVSGPEKSGLWADLRRAAGILWFTARSGAAAEGSAPSSGTPGGRSAAGDRLPLRWRIPALLLLTAGVALPARRALDGARSPYWRVDDTPAPELRAALRWLKAHSRPEDVVLAHWFRGHQVVAFADRRVVATTKVYPTEAREVAGRYRDIARFFLAVDEGEARSIAGRYGAAFVFADKRFQAWLCRAIDRCEFSASGGRLLNPEGLRRTVAGRMVRGAEFKCFQKVWDSPSFVIYNISEKPPGFSPGEKRLALAVAREALSRALAARPPARPEEFYGRLRSQGALDDFLAARGAGVALWRAGALRAWRSASEGSFIANLVHAAASAARRGDRQALREEELPELRIEVEAFHDDYAPLSAKLIRKGRIDPTKGYRLRAGSSGALVIPRVRIQDRKEGRLSNAMEELCRSAGLPLECHRRYVPESFSLEGFIEAPDGGARDLSGTLVVAADATLDRRLKESTRRAAEWLMKFQERNTRFAFAEDPWTGAVSPESSEIRYALSGQALAEASLALGDRRFLGAARRNAARLRERLEGSARRDPAFKPKASVLVFALLEDLALFDATRAGAYLDEAERWGVAVATGQDCDGARFGAERCVYTLRALARLLRRRPNAVVLRRARRLAELYEKRFRSNRILGRPMEASEAAWMAIGMASLYDVTGERSQADFVLEAARWLTDFQFSAGERAVRGAFRSRSGSSYAFARGTGQTAEAVEEAYRVARGLGNETLAARFHESLEQAFRWLFLLQYTRENAYFIPAKERVLGGFRHDLLNPALWNDSAAHFLLPASRYLRDERN